MQLPSIASSSQMFSLIGFDQVLPIARQLGLNVSEAQDALRLEAFIGQMMSNYSPYVSGVILSPEIGYRSILQKSETAGTLFCLERKLLDPDPLTVPLLMSTWNVETIQQNYGLAKLELFYNPTELEADTKRQMVAELYDYCQHQGIDFLLEVIVSVEATEREYKQVFQQLQLEAIQDLRRYCSLIALEYPLDALGSVTVTAELDIPWILTGRESTYEEFKENLRTVLESGAKGFLGTTQFLPLLTSKGKIDQVEFAKFVQTSGTDRVREMNRIVDEAAN